MSESEIPTKVPRCHPAAHIWCCCKAACLCTSKGCSNPVQSCPVQPRKISPHFGVIFATTLPKPLFFFSEIPREKGKKTQKTMENKLEDTRSPRECFPELPDPPRV